jgi:heterodisulfide reductase subunit A
VGLNLAKKTVRTGVYICNCGGNISDKVDNEKVKDVIRKLENVELVENVEFLCSINGQNLIKRGMKESGINRVVVSSCSPQIHIETFRKAVSEAGLNPYFLEIANIREHCSWVHENNKEATDKAIDIITGAVNRAYYLSELSPIKTSVRREVLVVGGGIAGIQTALEIADKGIHVYLVEKNPCIGGHMTQLSETFPTLDCSYCILAPRMVGVAQHPNITIISNSEPIEVKGIPGDYEVKIKKAQRFVDEEKCTACDNCSMVCPVEDLNPFLEGLEFKKAINIPFPQAVPRTYTIDMNRCIKCFKCVEVCDPGAINFAQKPEFIDLKVGAIVIATGYDQIDPKIIGEYSYGLHPDVMTNLEFERIMHLGFRRPSDGKTPKKVAFILCVGSRGLQDRATDYCCKIGCMVAIKQSLMFINAVPGSEAWIFYQDIRAHGRGYEEFYSRTREKGVKFVRGLAAKVLPTKNGLIVKAEDTILAEPVEECFDLVVLSTAMIPRTDNEKLSEIFGLQRAPDGFLLEKHYKLDPVDSARKGIYICGCALGPKDIRESVEQAMATGSRVTTFIGKGEFATSPEIPKIDRKKCNLCGECIDICPTYAITEKDSQIVVTPVSCINCGACVSACPRDAIDLMNFSERQLIEQIRGISLGKLKVPKIIVFLERRTAYASLDLTGTRRIKYPSNIRPILVPSCMRINVKHLLTAFAYGSDGVIFVEGDDSPFAGELLWNHVTKLKKELRTYNIKPLRLQSMITTIPQYEKLAKLFKMISARIERFGKISSEKRKKIQKMLKKEVLAFT